MINKNMEDYQEIENMMIICKGSLSSAEEWGGKLYQFEGLDYQTQNKDVVYVKGEALKDRLESLGIVLTEFKANMPLRRPVTVEIRVRQLCCRALSGNYTRFTGKG